MGPRPRWTITTARRYSAAKTAAITTTRMRALIDVPDETERGTFRTSAAEATPANIEGAAQGAAGAGAAIVMVGALFLIVRSRFDQELGGLLGVTPTFLPWHFALGMVALGAALGAGTALVTLRSMVRV